ncbi:MULTISPECIES: ABC transporter ATP-binding protein [unclassified Kitasatospora]|uniref:ABC transporter ATP-binding protein n=1 Tax=unclassified Kitasatospora TaxID=2633591 RepID=UPI0033E5B825
MSVATLPESGTAVTPPSAAGLERPGSADRVIRLRRELSTRPATLASAILLALVATAAALSVPLLVKEVIVGFATDTSVITPVLWMCLAAVGGAAAQAGAGYLVSRSGEAMIMRLRVRIMEHSLRLPLATVRTEGAGNLTARITSDALLLRQVVDVSAQVPLAVLTVVSTLGVMLWIDWILTLVTVGALALVTATMTVVLARLKNNFVLQQSAVGQIAQRFSSHLSALTTIKAYRAEALSTRALEQEADQLRAVSVKGARLETLIPAVTALANQGAMIAVILTGGHRMASGDLSMPDFAAFLLYLLQTLAPATSLTTAVGRLQAGLAARDRCNELLALDPEGENDTAHTVPEPVADAPAVVFDNVSYRYPGVTTEALDGVSFSMQRVGLTALVGASGAGKTTVLSLADRFVDVSGGRISLLGHDTCDWPLDALRARIAYVDQEFTLVEATVRENLQLGRTEPASEEELSRVLDAVGLAAEISVLPQGLDTVLGRESNLSGGQRQRMALARALLSQADVVLLDEPTSQLDGLNERRFRAIVDDLAASRAVIVVAHRLSTIQHADQVIMMDRGRVLDAADHRVLLGRCAAYRRLVETQALAAA